MTIDEARKGLRKSIADLAAVARGTCARSFADQMAVVDSDIDLLIEAARGTQAAECLAMVQRVNQRGGGHA